MIGLTGPQTRRIRITADDIIAHPECGALHLESIERIQEAMTARCATADALVRWALAGEMVSTKMVAALADLCTAAKVYRPALVLTVMAEGQAASRKKVNALFDSAGVKSPLLVDSMEMTGTDDLVVGEVFTVIDVTGISETFRVIAEEQDDWGRFLKIEKVTA